MRSSFGLLCAGALAMTMAAVPAQEAKAAPWTAPTYEDTFGHPGHAGTYAWGMATAIDGSILAGDYWNYAIQRFAPDGELLQTISEKGTGPGQNMGAHGVGVDPNDGSMYLADFNAPREIDKFDADGNYLFSFSSHVDDVTWPYSYVTRVTVGDDGEVYLMSSHNYTVTWTFAVVVVFDSNGNYLRHFGQFGEAPEDMGLTRGFTMGDNNELYLANITDHVIQVYDAKTGEFKRSFGDGRFFGDMRGIAVDRENGWVYVVDAQASEVEKFTTDGVWLDSWGSEGTGPDQFRDGGREITVGHDNNVYVADFGGNKINVYAPDGTFLRNLPSTPMPPPDSGFNQAQDVAVSADGDNIYTIDTFNHRAQRWDRDGNVVRVWGFRGTTADNAMNYPRGIAVDNGTGNVLVVNSRQGEIKRFTEAGDFISKFGRWGREDEDLYLPRGAWVAPDGSIVVGNTQDRRLKKFSASGELIWSERCGERASGTGPGVLLGCTGVTGDSDGNIYAAAVTGHEVVKFASDGTLLGTIGSGPGSANGELRGPYDVDIHNDLLYVSESNNNRISVFTLDGDFVGKFGSRGSGPGQFNYPRGIAIDDSGRLYVIDGSNEELDVFQITWDGSGGAPDTEAPTIGLTAPTADQRYTSRPAVLSGQATDDSGVGGVLVSIQDRDTKLWYQSDGSWGAWATRELDANLASPGATSTAWSFDFDPGSDGNYGVRVQAVDTSDNASSTIWQRFDIRSGGVGDSVEPDTALTAPAHRAVVPAGTVTIEGTVTDNVATATTQVAVRDRDAGLWWNPASGWQGGISWNAAAVTDAGATASTFSFDFTEATSGGRYYIVARSTDAAGNLELSKPSINISAS